jgi:hypothetical protein
VWPTFADKPAWLFLMQPGEASSTSRQPLKQLIYN